MGWLTVQFRVLPEGEEEEEEEEEEFLASKGLTLSNSAITVNFFHSRPPVLCLALLLGDIQQRSK